MGRKLKSPREFWQTLKTRSNSPVGETISTEEYYNHFTNLANIYTGENTHIYNVLRNFDKHRPTSTFPVLFPGKHTGYWSSTYILI